MLRKLSRYRAHGRYRTLHFDRPPRHAGAPRSDIRPHAMREWVANLPLANVGETAHQVLEILVDSNRFELPAKRRFALLEQLRRPAGYTARALKRHYLRQGFPLREQSAKIANLAEVLLAEQATGYKIIVEEVLASGFRLHRKLLTAAIQRAVDYQSRVLIISYETYRPCPHNIWAELHRLYECAEAHGLDKRLIRDEETESGGRSTISDSYKRALMLALADPYRLSQLDVERIYAGLEKWTALVELRWMGRHPATQQFMVNLERDEPPAYLPAANADPSSHRVIDSTHLIDSLQKELAGTDASTLPLAGEALEGEPVLALSRTTLERLLSSWGAQRARRAPRALRQGHAQVIFGLIALHGTVREDPEQLQQSEPPAPPPSFIPLGLPRTAEGLREPQETSGAPGGMTMTAPTGKPEMHTVGLADETAQGCRLYWSPRASPAIRVGELIAMREQHDAENLRWTLGALRWIRQMDDRIEAGVEWLASGSRLGAVTTVRMGAEQADMPSIKGVVLPEGSVEHQVFHLFTAPMPYGPGDRIVLAAHGVEKPALLAQLRQQTPAFAQFEFELIGADAEAPAAPAADANDLVAQFSALWSALR